jgi:Tfp pilus assembly protein PilV
MRPFCRKRRGFTLTEALIASVVMAISVIGISAALAASSAQSESTVEASNSAMLGRQLLEEIAAKPFPSSGTSGTGWSSGNRNRATYDDAGDYNGYTDSSPFTALSGASITTPGTYSRKVAVTRRTNPSDTPSSTGNFALISVTITAPSGTVSTYSTIIANIAQVRS